MKQLACVLCAQREAIDPLMQEVRLSYSWWDARHHNRNKGSIFYLPLAPQFCPPHRIREGFELYRDLSLIDFQFSAWQLRNKMSNQVSRFAWFSLQGKMWRSNRGKNRVGF